MFDSIISAILDAVFASLAESVGLSDWLRDQLKRDPEKLAFRLSLTQALNDVAPHFPGRDLRYFAEVLQQVGGPLLARYLQPASPLPTADELTQLWLNHLNIDSQIHYRQQFETFATLFLAQLTNQVENHSPLQWIVQARRQRVDNNEFRNIAEASQTSATALAILEVELADSLARLQETVQKQLTNISAYTEGGAYVGGDVSAHSFAGRDLTIKNYFIQGLPSLVLDYSSRIQDFLLEYLGSKRKRAPFGGRQQQLDELTIWLDDPSAPPYYLLNAEAGRGKSALVCRWLAQLTTRTDLDVIFVPISIRFETATQDVVFAALAARLANIYESGPEKLPPVSLTAEQWKGVCQNYLRREPPENRKLVVIFDGLDEATDWTPGRGLFSADPPEGLRVLVTARTLPDENDNNRWTTILGWASPELARTATLPVLDHQGVADAVSSMGAPLMALVNRNDIIDELHRISGGDPPSLKLILNALRSQGESVAQITIEQLRLVQPDLPGHFAQWWQQQQEQWQSQGRDSIEEQDHLRLLQNALAAAMEPLTFADFAALHPQLAQRPLLLKLLQGMSRWLVGNGNTTGYRFSHPRLGSYFWQQLEKNEQHEWDKRFTDWGATVLAELNEGRLEPINAPRYVLQHYVEHLQRSNAPATQFYALLSDGWRKAWSELDISYAGFLNDVERVWQVAKNSYAPNKSGCGQALAQMVRAALCQATIAALSNYISSELLLRLVELGWRTPTQALAITKRLSDEKISETLRTLAPRLTANQLGEALVIVRGIEDSRERSHTLCSLIPHLPVQLLGQALAIARTLEDDYRRGYSLIALVPRLNELEQAQVIDEVLTIARKLSESSGRSNIWTCLVPYLSNDLLDEALLVARTLESNHARADLLLEIASRLSETERLKILGEAHIVCMDEIKKGNLYSLRVLVSHLPNELLVETLTFIRSIESEGTRADALAVLSPYLRADSLEIALEIARSIEDKWDRSDALNALVPYVTAHERIIVLNEALAAARAIKEGWYRAQALLAPLPYLPDREKLRIFDEVLTAISMLGDDAPAKVLVKLAPHLPDHDQAKVVDEMLNAANRIEDNKQRATTLAELAQYLPKSEQMAIFVEALSAVRKIRRDNMLNEISREGRFTRLQTLNSFAQILPADLFDDAIGIACEINDDVERAFALGSLASRLPFELLSKSFEVVGKIKEEKYRARALSLLAPYLSDNLLDDALTAVRQFENERDRTEVLGGLVPALSGDLLDEALDIVSTFERERYNARSLGKLAPRLSGYRQTAAFREVLESMSEIDIGRLKEIVSHLPVSLFDEALNAAQKLKDERFRADALVVLIPHLPDHMLSEALTIAQTLWDDGRLVRVLTALIPRLSGGERVKTLKDAVVAARKIEKVQDRGTALASLAPYLPEPERAKVLNEVLAAVRSIANTEDRICTLGEVALYLSESDRQKVLEEALDAACMIEDMYTRANTLSALAPYLPTDLLRKALTSARTIRKGWSGADALIGIAPHLSDREQMQMLGETLAVTCTYELESHYSFRTSQLETLAPLLSNWAQQQPLQAYAAFAQNLPVVAIQPRPRFLEDLAALMPFILALAGDEAPQAAEGIYHAIQEVCEWWT